MLVAFAWAGFAALLCIAIVEAGEARLLDRRLAELGLQERQAARSQPRDQASESELTRAEYLSNHAAVRLADWNSTFALLARAMPSGTTVERLSLNAKSGRGEAIVRTPRVADATWMVEKLSVGQFPGSTTVRRCDQGSARSDAPMRCEIELSWRKSSP